MDNIISHISHLFLTFLGIICPLSQEKRFCMLAKTRAVTKAIADQRQTTLLADDVEIIVNKRGGSCVFKIHPASLDSKFCRFVVITRSISCYQAPIGLFVANNWAKIIPPTADFGVRNVGMICQIPSYFIERLSSKSSRFDQVTCLHLWSKQAKNLQMYWAQIGYFSSHHMTVNDH